LAAAAAILRSADLDAMDDLLYDLAREGALILTATRRLARTLIHVFDRRQVASGRTVWRQPTILPWGAWLESAWRETFPRVRLLTPIQALALWEDTIASDPSTRLTSLLREDATATLAYEANELAEAYDLPEACPTESTPEHDAFRRWRTAFRARCQAEGWLDPALLTAAVGKALTQRTLPAPERIVLAGFGEIPPSEQRLRDRLIQMGSRLIAWNPAPASPPAHLQRHVATDPEHELHLAASWIASQWQPAARIGVIVPNMAARRASIERIFRAELCPSSVLGAREVELPFNISLGIPLAEEPVTAAALAILDTLAPSLPWERAAALVQNPFFAEADSEWRARAALEIRIRTAGSTLLTTTQVAHAARATAPRTAARLVAIAAAAEAAARGRHRPSVWAATFADTLTTAGWPGERPTSSRETQAIAAWHETLDALAGLDGHVGQVDCGRARALLRRLSQTRVFQPESPDAPVQVLGLFEAAGLGFDRLWLMGADDETLPFPSRPHPLLPVGLQRRCGIPHASPDGALTFSRTVLDRLFTSAADVAVSTSLTRDGRPTQASPLVAAIPVSQPTWDTASRSVATSSLGTGRLTSSTDVPPPPLEPGESIHGGTHLLRDHAACPFRSFARYRLAARELDQPTPDLAPAEWGRLIHASLDALWDRLRDSSTLHALDSRSIERHHEDACDTAMAKLPRITAGERRVVRDRLLRAVQGWIDLERQRATSFQVVAREHPTSLAIGPLTLQLRIDRIDRLADGRYAILDYKTGSVGTSDWQGDRPLAPQLMLYAQVRDPILPRVDAVAFAHVKAGAHRFIGVAASDDILPAVAALPASRFGRQADIPDWRTLLVRWNRVAERLAESFAAGNAARDPYPGGGVPSSVCAQCPLPALCRINERTETGLAQAD